ncbi:hypothetical protein LX36DRAFT_728771 [Colletotrichum falcatum]|nr:hypothetical protein LX36DRAFT_728771 [Colletotrichum falcatum]
MSVRNIDRPRVARMKRASLWCLCVIGSLICRGRPVAVIELGQLLNTWLHVAAAAGTRYASRFSGLFYVLSGFQLSAATVDIFDTLPRPAIPYNSRLGQTELSSERWIHGISVICGQRDKKRLARVNILSLDVAKLKESHGLNELAL